MTVKTKKPRTLSLKDAFETEFARRAMERRARDEAERRQQEQDLANAEALLAALNANPEFLIDRQLVADRRRYTVSLDHEKFRIAAYFEAGVASVTSADKRVTTPGLSSPRKQEAAESVEDALRLMAQFLADEIR
jgi:hypothetical protein